MLNNSLLNIRKFKISQIDCNDFEKCKAACERLIANWSSELETQMLKAFIRLYYEDMYKRWGPDDEKESQKYWPEIDTPADLVKLTGTDGTLYALEDAIYAKSKIKNQKYESQNIDVCVILTINCPWDEDHGWAAVFIDGKFIKVDRDIVDCVWLD